MCGIAGFFDHSSSLNEHLLRQMTDAISYRGPDDSGYHFTIEGNTQIGLGHRRLAIIDLTVAGHQPMSKGNWMIVFNGEIYNYKSIREILEELGQEFTTNSDTEVILAAFEVWGVEAVHHFIGMFAFAIVNTKKQKAWLFRDRMGVKPLFYALGDKRLVFASELKAIMALPDQKRRVDSQALFWYLKLGYVPEPFSMLNGVNKLKAGNYLEVDLPSMRVQEVEYWSITRQFEKDKLDLSYEEAVKEFEKLSLDAFKLRLISDVPVGIFFSGGYDSTLVTSLLQKNLGSTKLKTFTIGFDDQSVDESTHASNVAAFLQTDHTSLKCTEEDAIEIIGQMPTYFDEPLSDISCIPTYLLSKKTREHVTVALSADGGDELFGGYEKYFANWSIYEKTLLLPAFIRGIIGQFIQLLPISIWRFFLVNADVRIENIVQLCSNDGMTKGLVTKIQASLYSESQICRLTNKKIKGDWSRTAFSNIARVLQYNGRQNALLSIDAQTFMRDDILVKIDRASMAVSLESREPLIDHRIVEFAARISQDFKIRDGVGKFILKDLVHKFVPKDIMDRPKQGFVIPLDNWLRSKLHFLIDEYLSEVSVNAISILDYKEVKHFVTDFNNHVQGSADRLWRLIILQMWLKHYNVRS